jgi:hypothetical protein
MAMIACGWIALGIGLRSRDVCVMGCLRACVSLDGWLVYTMSCDARDGIEAWRRRCAVHVASGAACRQTRARARADGDVEGTRRRGAPMGARVDQFGTTREETMCVCRRRDAY